jgi:hypothetical protein
MKHTHKSASPCDLSGPTLAVTVQSGGKGLRQSFLGDTRSESRTCPKVTCDRRATKVSPKKAKQADPIRLNCCGCNDLRHRQAKPTAHTNYGRTTYPSFPCLGAQFCILKSAFCISESHSISARRGQLNPGQNVDNLLEVLDFTLFHPISPLTEGSKIQIRNRKPKIGNTHETLDLFIGMVGLCSTAAQTISARAAQSNLYTGSIESNGFSRYLQITEGSKSAIRNPQ